MSARTALRICRALCGVFDESEVGPWHAGFQKPVTIMGEVSRGFPTKIPEMPFDCQVWKAVQQNFGRLCRFLGSFQSCESCRPDGEHLEMVGIQIQGFTRPGQRGIVLPKQIVAA